MDYEEKIMLEDQQDYHVVMANALIQKSGYGLSVEEQKTVAYIVSMIMPPEPGMKGFQLEYTFSCLDYCRICGIKYDSSDSYNDVKATLKKLRDQSIRIEMPDGSHSLVGWITKASVSPESGNVSIRVDEDLVLYLYDLQKKFED